MWSPHLVRRSVASCRSYNNLRTAIDGLHCSRQQLTELRSSKSCRWVPSLCACVPILDLLTSTVDCIGADGDICECIRVLVQERVQVSHGWLAGLNACLIEKANDASECGR